MIEDALDREADYTRMRDIYGGGSYRRGRDAQTGQYVSRGRMYPELGYSYNSPKHQAIENLEMAMHEARDENERAMYQDMINDLQMNH